MDRLINAIKQHAAGIVGAQGQMRWGIVSNVNPVDMTVRLMMQPENVLSGWLPVVQQAAGAGMTVLTVPMVGWQAAVMADTGEAEHSVVIGFSHNDGAQVPDTANALGTGGTASTEAAARVPGETIIRGPNGSVFRMCADGSGYFSGPMNVDGPLMVNGPITSTFGNITAQAGDTLDKHGSLDRLRGNYDAHKHVDPQGGMTGLTDHNDPE